MAEPIDALRSRVDDLETEIRDLVAKDELTTDEDARLDAALDERDGLKAELSAAETRQARLDAFKADQAARATEPVITDRTVVTDAPNVRTRTNPFDLDELRSMTPERRQVEVAARARDIIESGRGGYGIDDANAEHLTNLVSQRTLPNQRNTVARDVAEMIVHTGSDEYREAFEAVLADPSDIAAMSELQARQRELYSRAAIQTAGVSGAIQVPYQLDPTVILTNAGVVDPVRNVARTVQISGTDKWVAPTTAGITAGLISESAQFSDNTPTWSSTTIQTYKFGAFAFGSYESLADSSAAGELGMLFADAKARNDAGYLATGTGSSQPQGIVVFASNATSVVAGSSGAANVADLVAADIYAVRAALSPRWRQQAAWMGSLDVTYKIRQLGNTNNYHAFTLDLTQSDTLSLLGKPYYENSSMDTTIVSGSTDFVLLHGDFSQFVVVDRVGLTMKYQDIVTSGSKFPTGESAWHVYWRFGSGGLVQDAFRLLKL